MEKFTLSFNKSIKWVYALILLLAIILSATVYLKGEKIRHTADQLINQDIPTYNLFRQYQTQLNEQERYLYEYYATIDEQHFIQGYTRARNLASEYLLLLSKKFGHNPHLQQAQQNMQAMARLAEEFNVNMLQPNRSWDLAREQLEQLSQLRRQTIDLVSNLTNITGQRVAKSEQNIQEELWQVRGFVLLYGLITILISIMVGRGFKAYLATSAANNRLSLFPKRNPNPIISLDSSNRAIFSNPATANMLAKLALSQDSIHCLLPEDLEQYQQEILASNTHFKRYEYQVQQATLECELHWLADEKQWDIHLMDVSARKQAEQELQFQAFHHRETELENQYALNRILLEVTKHTDEFVLVLIEIRHFSQLLSSRGYDMTQMLVNELAQLLAQQMGRDVLEQASLYHVGQNNFAVLVKESGCEKLAKEFHAFLEGVIHQKSFHCQHQLELDYGFACYPQHGQEPDALLKSARAALEYAINEEHGSCVLYTHELGEKIAYEQNLINDIRQGIEQQQFELYFQPQLCLESHRIVGLEVLIRWQHQGKWVSPGEFIPLAEKSGLIVPLGDWILHTACEKARLFVDSGYPDIVVAVNISPKQFNRSDFIQKVQQALNAHQLPAANLELEITEGVIMYNEAETIDTLQQLKQLGVMLSIDDFGTGYSSLSYLKQFPVDKLKIDQSFVRHLQADEADRSIVRTVIDLGNNLSLKLIAEGVEEPEQLQLLKQMGCHEIQGYFFSRPLPEPELMTFLGDKHSVNSLA